MSKIDVKTILLKLVQDLDGRILERDKMEILQLIEHNEIPISIETLCVQLFEFEITISINEFERIRSLCLELGIKSEYYDPLYEVIEH